MGTEVFYGCEKLNTVNIPTTITTIPKGMFGHCINLTSITIPSTIITIEQKAFFQCGLTKISIPDSVQTIGDFAFYFCGISNVELGANIHDVNGSIFAKCNYLTNISISENNPYYYEKQDCLISKSNGSIALGITTSTIPEDNTVTSIADKAFYYVTLKNIHIPGNIVSIGNDVFIGSYLETITLSEGLVSIGDNAFVRVDKLIIPNSVTTIGAGALNAEYIVLGTNVRTMGQGALPVQNSTIFILSDYVIDTPHWSTLWSTLQIYIRDDMYNKYINKFPYSSYKSNIKPLSEYQGEIPTN